MKNNSNKIVKACIAISGLLLGLQTIVLAAEGIGENVFSIGPRATYSTPKDSDKGEWSPGAQARLHLSPVIGLEASIDYRKNDFGSHTTIKTYPIQASLLAYIIPGRAVSPFLLGGVGWYHTRITGPANFSNTTSRFGLHAGAGLEFMFNKSLSLDATYRYIWLESIASKDSSLMDKNYKDSGSMITIALNLLF